MQEQDKSKGSALAELLVEVLARGPKEPEPVTLESLDRRLTDAAKAGINQALGSLIQGRRLDEATKRIEQLEAQVKKLQDEQAAMYVSLTSKLAHQGTAIAKLTQQLAAMRQPQGEV